MAETLAGLAADPLFWTLVGVTLLAGLVRGFAGFGSAMLMAPVFASLIGPAEAVVTVVLVEMLVSVQLFPPARRLCEWRTIGPMAIAACLAMPAGAWLLRSADPRALVVAVSAIVLVFVLVLASGWRYRGRQGPAGAVAVGAVSGAMMATTSVGGPPVLLYLLAGTSPPEIQRANIIVYYFLTQFLLLAIVAAIRPVGGEVWIRALVLVIPMLAGSFLGQRLFRQADAMLYRRIALAVLFAAGAFGLARGILTSA